MASKRAKQGFMFERGHLAHPPATVWFRVTADCGRVEDDLGASALSAATVVLAHINPVCWGYSVPRRGSREMAASWVTVGPLETMLLGDTSSGQCFILWSCVLLSL